MENWFESLIHSQNGIGICGIAMSCIVIVTAIISKTWGRVRRAEMEALLKHKMLDQGMSAEDIKKVLESGSPNGCGTRVIINK
jgi:hypothetical protein